MAGEHSSPLQSGGYLFDKPKEDITLYLKGLTPDEKEIILDGCLMNYYAKRME